MKWWEIVLCILGISFCHYAYIKAYANIFYNKIHNCTYKSFIFILVITILTFYNTFYNYNFIRIILSFIELMIIFRIIFKDDLQNLVIKTIILYFLGWLVETILGLCFAYFLLNSVQQFDNNVVIKVLFSTFMMLVILLCSNVKNTQKLLFKIYEHMQKAINIVVTISLFIIVLALLTFYLIISNNIISDLSLIFLIGVLSFLFIMLIIQSIKARRANEKHESLLKFMKEYEIIVDKERIGRHEMENNLLILKSIKNKNTEEYNNILNEILESYKSVNPYRNLYDLPSGLKGLFYYKIYKMQTKNIEIFINISNKAIKKLEKLNTKFVAELCKIIGILLDNAKEAAEVTKEKSVIIDIYNEREEIIIYIENSCDKNIDISKINIKGYSTKGNSRGYGLYLVKQILEKNNKIELKQSIKNKKFISVIKYKM